MLPLSARRAAVALPSQMRGELGIGPGRFLSSSEVPSDHYDLRAAGAEAPEPFEVNGEPTDITKSLAKGGKQIGYSSRYARSWDRIFASQAHAEGDGRKAIEK